MTALGLGDGMRFVVYDVLGLFAAARVWWTLRAYGAHDVRILEGGLTQWIVEGRPLETGEAHPKPRAFTPRLDPGFVASLEDVQAALASGSAQIVDARPADRFRGEAPEPRPGLRSGHMPGSLNVPFGEIVEHGRLKPSRGSPGDLRGAQGRSRKADRDHLRLRASARRFSRSRSRRRAERSPVSTTAPGRNGAGARTARSRPARKARSTALALIRGTRL